MCDIYRIFECRNGFITKIIFLSSEESAGKYLEICKQENEPDTFYFAQKIKVQE